MKWGKMYEKGRLKMPEDDGLKNENDRMMMMMMYSHSHTSYYDTEVG